jgi:hypothetical protein
MCNDGMAVCGGYPHPVSNWYSPKATRIGVEPPFPSPRAIVPRHGLRGWDGAKKEPGKD